MDKEKINSNKKVVIFIVILLILVLVVYFLTDNEKDIVVMKNVDMLDLGIEAKYDVITEKINYFENVNGFLAKPSQPGSYSGIIMIHEWWGLNDNIMEMAKQLAAQGYIVLAVDLYDGQVATTPDKARELVTSLNQEKAINNMKAAKNYLKENQNADKIASLGWCFGGGQSLQITLNSDDIDATVIYYGNLVTNESELSKIENPVLGIFGSEDTSIPVATINEFDSALDKLNIENEVYIYDGVGHAFANPSGMNYAPKETNDAWIKTVSFLEKNLKD